MITNLAVSDFIMDYERILEFVPSMNQWHTVIVSMNIINIHEKSACRHNYMYFFIKNVARAWQQDQFNIFKVPAMGLQSMMENEYHSKCKRSEPTRTLHGLENKSQTCWN